MKRMVIAIVVSFLCLSTAPAAHAQTIVRGVPILSQLPQLPTGCEDTALAMLLNWAGVNIDKETVVKELPKGPAPSDQDGQLVGGNPEEEFVGDPYSEHGFGIYQKPVIALINKHLPNQAQDLTGKSFGDLLKVIDSGRPVMVWATGDMEAPYISASWVDEKNQEVDWPSGEHALVMVGYDDHSILVNDPYTGKLEHYPKELFQKRWEELGKRAVTILPKASQPTSTPIAYSETKQLEKQSFFQSIFSFVRRIFA